MNQASLMSGGGTGVKSALSGLQRMSVGGGKRVPSFGPAVSASPIKQGNAGLASPGLVDMLSRPKRTRQSGIKKTAGIKGAASLGASMPPGGSSGTLGGY